MKVRTTLAALAALTAVLALGAGSASAAFPGSNGKIAFMMDVGPTGLNPAATNQEIFTVNPDGTGLTRLTSLIGNDVDPAWNHQGTQLAFVNGKSSWPGLYAMNRDGSSLRRLTANEKDRRPAWSPDGARIAFSRDLDLYVINADGSGARRVVQVGATTGLQHASQPAWSPDGKTIAFTCRPQYGATEICLLDIATGTIRSVASGFDPAWSPNGERIAFFDYVLGNADIFTIRADGSERRRLTDTARGESQPAWSPDGTKIVYQSSTYGSNMLYVMSSDGSGQHPIVSGLPANDGRPDWQPLVRLPGLNATLP